MFHILNCGFEIKSAMIIAVMNAIKAIVVSPLSTKEHPYKVKKKILQGSFFMINEKVKNRI